MKVIAAIAALTAANFAAAALWGSVGGRLDLCLAHSAIAIGCAFWAITEPRRTKQNRAQRRQKCRVR